MESRIVELNVTFKRKDPTFLFQLTRSSDLRILKCCVLKNKDGTLSKQVARMTEDEKTIVAYDNVVHSFLQFSEPIEFDRLKWETTLKALPQRKIIIDFSGKTICATTTINGHPNSVIVGVHVTMDIPSNCPPLLRGVLLVGIDRKHALQVSENLPITGYLQEIAKSCLGA